MPSISRARTKLKEARKDILRKKNVVGVAVGTKKTDGVDTGKPCVVAFVNKKGQVSDKDRVPRSIDDVPTDVVEIGDVSIQHKTRHRPVMSGISAGHIDITAGTLGAVVRDKVNGDYVMLSNNHVFANSNDADIGDAILQPGRHDGGNNPVDRVGHLRRFIPIDLGEGAGDTCEITQLLADVFNVVAEQMGRKSRLIVETEDQGNTVDAAIAALEIEASLATLGLAGRAVGIAEANPGDRVFKAGRTTGFTEGRVEYVDAEVDVNFGDGRIARFKDQIVTTHMSEGGDSGSVVYREDHDGLKAVGLLFAGSPQVTILNRMSNVVDLLDIEF